MKHQIHYRRGGRPSEVKVLIHGGVHSSAIEREGTRIDFLRSERAAGGLLRED